MALIYCRECGQQISELAGACPKCGAPQNKKRGNRTFLTIMLVIAFVFTGLALFYVTQDSSFGMSNETRQDRIDEADRLLARDKCFRKHKMRLHKNDFKRKIGG
ncbi:MAG TPA: hypothetical protein VGC65_08545 [Bacteroidia bacterium]|jgi:predicted nucleic acid-binding Zn ribbon protein